MSIKNLLKRLQPATVKKLRMKLFSLKLAYDNKKKYKKVRRNQKEIVRKLEKKNKLKIAFFLLNTDTWKLDSLYWSFHNHPRFEPIVIICPFIGKG